MGRSDHKRLVEAALFMSPEPLSINELSRISGLGSLGQLKGLLNELMEEYSGRGIQITENPLGWKMEVRQDLLQNVAHLAPYSDLSEGCKRTLALVVYKEPIDQADVIKIQGNKAYSYIKKLVKAGLVRAEKTGRTKKLHLTKEFEKYFGQEKEKIKERVATEFN